MPASGGSQMSILESGRRALKKIAFGDTLLPQEFTIGLGGPQSEIAVWLHGLGAPRDVTHRHSTACSAPFVICVAFEEGHLPNEKELKQLSLKFCERNGHGRVLGEIGLKLATGILPAGSELLFFEARSSVNYCLPKMRLGIHYLRHAYSAMGKVDTSGMKMSFLERRAAIVSFIRPHPTSLVSLEDEMGGNIFIMNLMGELGGGRFAFGLKDSRKPAHLVERAGRIAVSGVPFRQGQVALRFAANHFKQSIEWDQLPFATKRSTIFNIPVPDFALRVREMEVETIRKIGSHTFFVAKVVSDERFYDDAELHAIHGFYQAWRLKGRSAELKASLAEDSFNKQGLYSL
jgi:flavin reductase (DIM6/NTAB) family NADH-FMN oxidoreductase RutF